MQFRFTFFILFFASLLSAQTVIDFENLSLPDTLILNGKEGTTGYQVDNIFLPNNFTPAFNSWTGWAISATTDTITPGFTNQYSAIAGSGFEGSTNYAVAYLNPIIKLDSTARGSTIEGMYVTNNTYTFLSMQDGDFFAKKFGGLTGNDPDFFVLTIRAIRNGAITADSVDFYLAD